jgi:hypothetical protein
MKKVAIILINYKDYAQQFLIDCRDSLYQQTYSNFQVYIVDNASSEESFNYLHLTCPEAKILVRSDGNYSAGNNLGIREAIKDGHECLVVANMDTRFDKSWLEELMKAHEKEPQSIIQSKILLNRKKGDSYLINSLGNHLHYLAFGFTNGYMEKDYILPIMKEIKGYVSGCSFLITKEIFEKIGGYNEEYYMYHDDMEISLKAKLVGYHIFLASQSVVYHKYEFSRSVKMIYYMERNRYITIFSFLKKKTIFLILPPLILMNMGMMIFSIFNGWFTQYLRIQIYFLKPSSWKKIRENRGWV